MDADDDSDNESVWVEDVEEEIFCGPCTNPSSVKSQTSSDGEDSDGSDEEDNSEDDTEGFMAMFSAIIHEKNAVNNVSTTTDGSTTTIKQNSAAVFEKNEVAINSTATKTGAALAKPSWSQFNANKYQSVPVMEEADCDYMSYGNISTVLNKPCCKKNCLLFGVGLGQMTDFSYKQSVELIRSIRSPLIGMDKKEKAGFVQSEIKGMKSLQLMHSSKFAYDILLISFHRILTIKHVRLISPLPVD